MTDSIKSEINLDDLYDLTDVVSKIIVNFMATSTPFTILDISEAVKTTSSKFFRHRQVHAVAKPILINFLSEFYTTSLIEVDTPNGKASAMLYHRTNYSPDYYTTRNRAASKPTTQSTAQTPTQTTNKTVVTEYIMQPRADGKVQIPQAVIVESGLTRGLPAGIKIHPNSLTISNDVNNSDVDIFLTQDCRLSYQILQACNLYDMNIKFVAHTNKIVVSKA